MPTIDVISANLPVLRGLHRRLGQLELAKRVDVSRRTIARLEKAEVADPGVELISRIAQELGVSLSVLTESKLRELTLALPEDVCQRLSSDAGADVLDAMIRAARQTG